MQFKKATAKFNMSFDDGHFKYNKKYKYKLKEKNIFITTEQDNQHIFNVKDFYALFRAEI